MDYGTTNGSGSRIGCLVETGRTAKGNRLFVDRAHHLIEQFFNKLKQYRSIATRYDKTARNFLGAIHLANAVIWLN